MLAAGGSQLSPLRRLREGEGAASPKVLPVSGAASMQWLVTGDARPHRVLLETTLHCCPATVGSAEAWCCSMQTHLLPLPKPASLTAVHMSFLRGHSTSQTTTRTTKITGTSLVIQWLGLHLPTQCTGSIPGWGPKILHVSRPKNKIKQKQYCKIFNEDFKNSPYQNKTSKIKTTPTPCMHVSS